MPDVPEFADGRSTDKESPKATPSDERTVSGRFPISVRMAPSDPSDVEIARAGAATPLVLHLPASVARIVSEEVKWETQIPNPAAELAQKYKEWEDGTAEGLSAWGKGIATCFDNSCAVPGLLFWVLDHFSDSDFPLTEGQQDDLTFHTFDEAQLVRSCHVSELKSTETADSLEYCWYFLVRLLAIEAELSARNRPNPSLQRHLQLIHCHKSLLIRDLKDFHELGWITTASPREDIERKLIDMAASQPNLKPIAARLIRDWDAIEEDAEELLQIAESRSERLGGEACQAANDVGDGEVSQSAKRQLQVMQQIRCLEQVMTPESARSKIEVCLDSIQVIVGRGIGQDTLKAAHSRESPAESGL